MLEKYFVTIMKKIPIGDNQYVYKFDTIAAGDIDEKTNVLTTTNNEKIKRIDDFSDFENTNQYYTNIVEVNHLSEIYAGYTFSEAVGEYESRCKQIVYFITKCDTKDGFMIIPIDTAPFEDTMKMLNEMSENVNQNIQSSEYNDEDGLGDCHDSVIAFTKLLAQEVTAGKFTPDELLDIQTKLEEQNNIISSTLRFINTQLDELNSELEKLFIGNEQFDDNVSLDNKDIKKETDKPIDVNYVYNKITEVIIAQEKPARRMLIELARLDKMRKKDYGILLTGESGVGKTLLMSLLGKYLNRPFLHIDSTQLTAPGIVGQSIEQQLWQLYESCGRDINITEKAIVFFDEIDKKGSNQKNDVSGQAVLNTLLKFLDGTTYTACKNGQQQTASTTVRINTSNMIKVVGGAFLDVYNSQNTPKIGFLDTETKKESEEPTTQEFIDKAMMTKELMGRVPVIIKLNNLDICDLTRILLESKDSALKLQEEVFADVGVKLTTKMGYISSVAEKAYQQKVGARGLNKIVTDTTWQAYDDVVSNPGIYEEVILTEDTVDDNNAYQLVKRQEKNHN